MALRNQWIVRFGVLALIIALTSSCGFRRKKYENPIAKDTEQPDKVLFDKAIADLERSRFEVARLTLQTLMNTYDTSEYLAKAKLAYADSWYREGGSHGLAQAEAEYKDFILFYPTLEESAEAQEKVCMIHYRQMEKPDRDMTHALRAEDECRNLLMQFPNSKFAPRAQQLLRNVQEVIAEGEMRRGAFYHNKGSHPAAANRLQGLTDQYPLYSRADEANWMLGDSYSQMGPRFRDKAGAAYTRIVREYPLSDFVGEATKRLQAMELPVPEADPVAYARMKFELENREDEGALDHALGILKRGPNVKAAAKSGTPAMTSLRPGIPANVPVPGSTPGTGVSAEVTATQITDSTALDTQPDARNRPAGTQAQEGAAVPQDGKGSAETGAARNPDAQAETEDDKKGNEKKKDSKKPSK